MLRWVIRFVLALLVTGPALAAPQFDTPLKTEIIPTGAKTTLHCLTFPNFLLKWEDEGHYGAVIYILKGRGPWVCAATMKGELHFGSWAVVRVEDRYIFLSAKPSPKYGMPFTVFDTKAWRYILADSIISDFSGVRGDGEALVLQYRRPINLQCSLYYGVATECWGLFKAATGLTDAMMPACAPVYAARKKEYNVADITGYPASLTYNAEARITIGKASFTPRPGPVDCDL